MGDELGSVFDLIEVFKRIEYFGSPNASFLEWDRTLPGAALSLTPDNIGGFTRSATG